jgi:hypothetical protein
MLLAGGILEALGTARELFDRVIREARLGLPFGHEGLYSLEEAAKSCLATATDRVAALTYIEDEVRKLFEEVLSRSSLFPPAIYQIELERLLKPTYHQPGWVFMGALRGALIEGNDQARTLGLGDAIMFQKFLQEESPVARQGSLPPPGPPAPVLGKVVDFSGNGSVVISYRSALPEPADGTVVGPELWAEMEAVKKALIAQVILPNPDILELYRDEIDLVMVPVFQEDAAT